MAWFAAIKDLRMYRERGDRYRQIGRIDEALHEYRALMRGLAESGLRLRATATCRLILELAPDDDEAMILLGELTGRARHKKHDITLEVQLDDVLVEALPEDHPDALAEPAATPPPLPGDHDDDLELRRRVARGSRLFAGLHDEHDEIAEAVIHALYAQVLPAGSPLMRAARASPGLYAIVAGEIEVVGSDAPGGVPRCVVGAGHLVGEMSALPENLASGDVVARTATTALFLSTRRLSRLAGDFPALRAHLDKLSICRRALDSRLRPDSPTALG